MDFDHTYADYLDSEGVRELEALEKESGKRILAYYSPPASANLTDRQLEKIKTLEQKLCVRLVAYERPHSRHSS